MIASRCGFDSPSDSEVLNTRPRINPIISSNRN
ncbi:hypothetical protein RSAG8_08981, partial [Rhizoctonia solani AG-8 WAC10335]